MFNIDRQNGWIIVLYKGLLALHTPDTGLTDLTYIKQAIDAVERFGRG